jgi:hypothetical protein
MSNIDNYLKNSNREKEQESKIKKLEQLFAEKEQELNHVLSRLRPLEEERFLARSDSIRFEMDKELSEHGFRKKNDREYNQDNNGISIIFDFLKGKGIIKRRVDGEKEFEIILEYRLKTEPFLENRSGYEGEEFLKSKIETKNKEILYYNVLLKEIESYDIEIILVDKKNPKKRLYNVSAKDIVEYLFK